MKLYGSIEKRGSSEVTIRDGEAEPSRRGKSGWLALLFAAPLLVLLVSISWPSSNSLHTMDVPLLQSTITTTCDSSYSCGSNSWNMHKITSSGTTDSSSVGSGRSINNMEPYLGVTFIIALVGVYPSRSRRLSEQRHYRRRLNGGAPYIGEIYMFGGNFAPRGFAMCDGSLLQVSENEALFSLIGSMYGGDGRTTFGLPDLRGRAAVGYGSGPGLTPRQMGAMFGTETETMTFNQMPSHAHTMDLAGFSPITATLSGTNTANDDQSFKLESISGPTSATTSSSGYGNTMNNMQPSLVLNIIIALTGSYPSRNRRGLRRRSLQSSEPYLGDITIAAFDFAPRGWAQCTGGLQSISQNQALYSLLGTTYGGDGRTTFGLPDLRGRLSIHPGSGYVRGQESGSEFTAVSSSNLPSHSHTVAASDITQLSGVLSRTGTRADTTTASFSTISGSTLATATTGSGSSVANMQPYLTVNYIIALTGIFPSQSRRLEADESDGLPVDGQHRRRLDSDPLTGQIAMFAGNFAPRGWAFCDGSLLQVSQYTELFAILGTIYGGDGRTTFALPNLEGRTPIHWGQGAGLSNRHIGQKSGTSTISLSTSNLPAHTHAVDPSSFSPMSFTFERSP